jgi:hypothetical protein
MTSNSTATDGTGTGTNWQVDYDVDPIEIRDPVAEALGVLEPGEPFVITYTDAVKEAGHSCPTASGAYRIAQLGLHALYSDGYPVRSEIEVRAAGPRDDTAYGVMSRIISYVTGATEDDGFRGLTGDYGGRRDLLRFDAFDPDTPDPTFRFRRTDADETIEATYHVSDVPDGGPRSGISRGFSMGRQATSSGRSSLTPGTAAYRSSSTTTRCSPSKQCEDVLSG